MDPDIYYNESNDLVYNNTKNPDVGPIIYNLGDSAWVLTSTALVFFMIPGVALLYAGTLRRKNALSQLWMAMCVTAVVTIQWVIWGYSLTYSDTGGSYIGNLKFSGLQDALDGPPRNGDRIPVIIFAVFQLMFACFTAMITVGAFAERARLRPVLVFVFCFTTLVYDPVAYWTWNPNGWSSQLGGLDFAGGTPVHIVSGAAALVISWFLQPRDGWPKKTRYTPHNSTYIFLGTAILWFGWMGFNGGSALGANLQAGNAILVTNVAASTGGLTWMLIDCYYWKGVRSIRPLPLISFCSGAVSGLIAITPAAGYVGAPAAIAFGVVSGTLCNYATGLKKVLKVDDKLDIFATHCIGGVVGNIMTAFLAQRRVEMYNGNQIHIDGGWIDHHWIQLGFQIADSVAGFAYASFMTLFFLVVINLIPGLQFRMTSETEPIGQDLTEIGQYAYDYVWLMEDFPEPSQETGTAPPAAPATVPPPTSDPIGRTQRPHHIEMTNLASQSNRANSNGRA